MAESGHVEWPSSSNPIWRFNWRLADAPDEEGIVISQAYYRGHKVFWKASLPSLRVQYDGNRCGPYKDPLNYNNARTTSRCPGRKVCVYSYWFLGFGGVVVESYHTIGAYRLLNRWIFWNDGQIYPRLYSAGLQCPYDHRHHAYWRFDFDINGAGSDLVLEYNTYTADQGWGPGWHDKTREISRVKNSGSRRSWAIMDTDTWRGYHIIPGTHDGSADVFANRDLWVLRFHWSEDKHGRQGSAYDDELANYLTGEDVDSEDDVVWYCGHLEHEAEEGADEWHSVGPRLIPFRYY